MMRYIKLFEKYSVNYKDFPEYGHPLSKRESDFMSDMLAYLKNLQIKKDDGYYYTSLQGNFNRFEEFRDLVDYVKFRYYMKTSSKNKLISLLGETKLDMSFDNNCLIKWADTNNQKEIFDILLKDPNVDPLSIFDDLKRASFTVEIKKVDDGYHVVNNIWRQKHRNKFTSFYDLKDYVFLHFYIYTNRKEFIEDIVRKTKINLSFDDNFLFRIIVSFGYKDLVELLLDKLSKDLLKIDHKTIMFMLKTAKERNYKEVLDLLLEDPIIRKHISDKDYRSFK